MARSPRLVNQQQQQHQCWIASLLKSCFFFGLFLSRSVVENDLDIFGVMITLPSGCRIFLRPKKACFFFLFFLCLASCATWATWMSAPGAGSRFENLAFAARRQPAAIEFFSTYQTVVHRFSTFQMVVQYFNTYKVTVQSFNTCKMVVQCFSTFQMVVQCFSEWLSRLAVRRR